MAPKALSVANDPVRTSHFVHFARQRLVFGLIPEVLKDDVDGLWHLKVTSEGNPALLMSIGAARKLLNNLRSADADDLANDLNRQIEKAYRYAGLKSETSVTGIEPYRD
jgi:hypothetical protein